MNHKISRVVYTYRRW